MDSITLKCQKFVIMMNVLIIIFVWNAGCLGKVTDSVAPADSVQSSSAPIHLKLVHTCGSTASLTSSFQGTDKLPDSTLLHCELTYYCHGKSRAQIIDIALSPHSETIRLFNLTQGNTYTVFMVCNDISKTNEVSFVSGSHCYNEPADDSNKTVVTLDSDKPVVSSYSPSTSYNSVEWPIAITFAVVGIIMCAVVAVYLWKKYQRRQRILRIFRQGQNDPFQALYSPTQDSYSF